jgi:hypothetical protein
VNRLSSAVRTANNRFAIFAISKTNNAQWPFQPALLAALVAIAISSVWLPASPCQGFPDNPDKIPYSPDNAD